MSKFLRSAGIQALIVVMLLLAHTSSSALKFAENADDLYLYDCGSIGDNEKDCRPFEKSFFGPVQRSQELPFGYAGDAVELEARLARKKFRKIFLISGGGDLSEGVKIGRIFRRYGTYLVVPERASCVSACTVAFLGGMLREVEAGAKYKVHAYSSLVNISPDLLKQVLGSEGDLVLAEFAKLQSNRGKRWAIDLMKYSQEMLNGQPNTVAYDRFERTDSTFYQEFRDSGRLKMLHRRIQLEGIASVQDILMSIEREAFEKNIDLLKKQIDHLGTRAMNAADVLDLMFSCRIQTTCELDQITLRERGYTNVRR